MSDPASIVPRRSQPPEGRAIERLKGRTPEPLDSSRGWQTPSAVEKSPRPGLPASRVAIGQTWAHADWQKLWLATQRASWRSLALVPAGEMPSDFTLEIAVALARTGSMHLGVLLRIADATQVPLAHLMQFMTELESMTRAGDLVMVALGPLLQNPTTVAVAQACDQALLCVPLGVSQIADAKRTISQIGARRFLGSVVFRL